MRREMSKTDKIAVGVLVLAIAAIVYFVILAAGNAEAARTRWPRQFTVNGSAVGDTSYTLPPSQPVKLSLVNPPVFKMIITATGAYALPNITTLEVLADGSGADVRLLNATAQATMADSLYVDDMGTASNIYLFGY